MGRWGVLGHRVGVVLLAVTAAAGCGTSGPSLRFAVDPDPTGMAGIVKGPGDWWVFGISGLCLSGRGQVRIRAVRLDDSSGLVLQEVGVKELTDPTDAGVGAVQESMAEHGYRTKPLLVSTPCPDCSGTGGGMSSLALKVASTGQSGRGIAKGVTIDYSSEGGGGVVRSLRSPTQLELCERDRPTEHCGQGVSG